MKILCIFLRSFFNRLPFSTSSTSDLDPLFSMLFPFLAIQSVKEYIWKEIAEDPNKHVRYIIRKLSVYLELKQNISIKDIVNASLVSFIFTFGRKKHFILLFTLSLYQNKIKKNSDNTSKEKCMCCLSKVIWETYSVYVWIQVIYVLNNIDVEFYDVKSTTYHF